MRIFVAGASGAIGQPLIAGLIKAGHEVMGMSRSEEGANRLIEQGVQARILSAFDLPSLQAALREFEPEIVVDELTSLPKDPADIPKTFPEDRRLRLEGGGNLQRVAQACGVRRYIQQSSGFFLKSKSGLADESCSLAVDASPGISASARMYAEIEARLLNRSGKMEAILLRYGFFYGPETWYSPEGAMAGMVRRSQYPIIGSGEGVWSFIHIEDAASATVAAIAVNPGIYNVVDDDPVPVSTWLPEFAEFVGAPEPPIVTEEQAQAVAGDDAVYYGTKLCGASNAKAKTALGFQPRRLEWLE